MSIVYSFPAALSQLMFTPFIVWDFFAFPFTVTSNDVGAVAFGFNADDTFVHSGLYIGFIVLPSDTAIVPAAVIVSVLFALNDVLFLYIDSGAYITAPDLPVPVNISS